MIRVAVLTGADRGRAFELSKSESLIIGRGAESDTKLRDPTVSRLHCMISIESGRILLTDKGSSTGTHVNGEKISRRLLFPGDTIRLGDTQLRIEQPELIDAMTVAPLTSTSEKDSDTTFQLGTTQAEQEQTLVSEYNAARDLSFLPGREIEQYRIVRELATGKTGVLFLAVDQNHQREVAIKVVWPDICEKPAQRRRFKEAMRAAYRISHPGVVELYRAGSSKFRRSQQEYRLCWAAMEYVQGCSFRYIVDRAGVAGMLDWRIAWKAAVQVAEALEYLHGRGVMHRNISPDNILLSQTEARAKLSGLMIARALDTGIKRNTGRGEVIGEPAYMPPERTLGDSPLDCRSDIYSLGATLYAVVAGQPPFEADSLTNLVWKIQNDKPIPPRTFQMSINESFEFAIMRMMDKRPAARFRNASELLRELNRIGQYAGLPA